MEKNLIQKQGGQMSAAKAEKKTMQAYIKAMEPAIKKALPSVITPERFTRMVLSALSSTPKLAECSPQSFLAAMMTAAQLGVEPNTALGQAYLLPYRNHGQMECQFQLGYKGLIDLAYRSGEVSVIQAHTVYENDVFEYELGMDPKLRHVPAKADRGEAVAYYAMFKTKDGGYGFEVMSVDDVQRHAQRYSKSYGSGSSPWRSNFDEMAKKTVLKRALKYAPLKSDFVRGVAQDETIKAELSDEMYAVPDETVFEAEGEEIDSTSVDTETGEVIGDAE
jgi:recombination protein RecT